MSQEKAAEIIDLNASREAAAQSAGQPAGGNAGEFLAKARRAAGLGLAEISAATKIKIDHLAAIEATDAEALPATPYAVGFVKVYARHLGLDGDEVSAQFKEDIGANAPEPEIELQEEAVVSAPIGDGARLASIFGIIAILVFVGWIVIQITSGKGGERVADIADSEPQVTLGTASTQAPEPRRITTLEPIEEPPVAVIETNEVVEPVPSQVEPESAAAVIEAPETAAPIVEAPVAVIEEPAAALDVAESIEETLPPAAFEAPPAAPADVPETMAAEELTPADNAPDGVTVFTVEELPALEPLPMITRPTPPVVEALPEPVIIEAKLRRSLAPKYPERCDRDAAEIESVTLAFDVTPAGRIANARAVSSTNACFNSAALSTIKRWRFSPKTVDGAPAADIGKQATLNFRR